MSLEYRKAAFDKKSGGLVRARHFCLNCSILRVMPVLSEKTRLFYVRNEASDKNIKHIINHDDSTSNLNEDSFWNDFSGMRGDYLNLMDKAARSWQAPKSGSHKKKQSQVRMIKR